MKHFILLALCCLGSGGTSFDTDEGLHHGPQMRGHNNRLAFRLFREAEEEPKWKTRCRYASMPDSSMSGRILATKLRGSVQDCLDLCSKDYECRSAKFFVDPVTGSECKTYPIMPRYRYTRKGWTIYYCVAPTRP